MRNPLGLVPAVAGFSFRNMYFRMWGRRKASSRTVVAMVCGYASGPKMEQPPPAVDECQRFSVNRLMFMPLPAVDDKL
jgi:hypothetical protein